MFIAGNSKCSLKAQTSLCGVVAFCYQVDNKVQPLPGTSFINSIMCPPAQKKQLKQIKMCTKVR